MHDCSISSALAMEILQSCAKPSVSDHRTHALVVILWDAPPIDLIAEGSMIQSLTSKAVCIVTSKMFRKWCTMQWVRLFHGRFCDQCTWTVEQTSNGWTVLWSARNAVQNVLLFFSVFLFISELSNHCVSVTHHIVFGWYQRRSIPWR